MSISATRFVSPPPIPPLLKQSQRSAVEVIDKLDVKVGVPIGVTFPAPVFNGVIPYMANLDQSWVNINVDDLMQRYLGRAVVALNDADAAGIAEVAYGAAKGRDGVIVFTTQGTGIGSAIIVNGMLLTNTELGHLEIDGTDAEKNASSGQKTLQGLNWEQWAQRLQRYYSHVEFLLNPDLFVVGGGVSENHEKFMPLLKLKTPMIPAKLLNTAGIVGAAYYAAQQAPEHTRTVHANGRTSTRVGVLPGSVGLYAGFCSSRRYRTRGGDHLSRTVVTDGLQQPTRRREAGRPACYSILLRVGFT